MPSTTLSKTFFFDEEARAGAAALAVIEEDGHGGAGNGGFEIGVVDDDVGRFAAEFERNFLQVAGRGVNDELADFGRAGEGDFVDVHDARRARHRRFRRSRERY